MKQYRNAEGPWKKRKAQSGRGLSFNVRTLNRNATKSSDVNSSSEGWEASPKTPRLLIWTENPEKSLRSKWQDKPAYIKVHTRGEGVWDTQGRDCQLESLILLNGSNKIRRVTQSPPRKQKFQHLHAFWFVYVWCMALFTYNPSTFFLRRATHFKWFCNCISS